MKQPIKMTPGDDLHLTLLMAPFSLNLVTGQDRQHLLGYGRAAFEAGKAGQCLHQIQEPAAAEQAAWHAGLDEGRAQAAPAAVAVQQPENIREGAPYDAPEFEQLARDLGVWGTAQSAVCAQFWMAAQGSVAPVVLPEPDFQLKWSASAGRYSFSKPITGDVDCYTADTVRALMAQKLAIMPKGESATAQLRAMATNYPTGHSWDKLDAKACIRGALEIEALRAQVATATGFPAQADMPDSYREWFAKNYPADTIIVDPDWHAKSIFRMAQAHARLAAPQAQADARDAARWRESLSHVYSATKGNGQPIFGISLSPSESLYRSKLTSADQYTKDIDAAIAAAKGE